MLLILLQVPAIPVHAQDDGIAVRTDLLYWLSATPNIAVEWPVSGRVAVAASFGYNSFNFFNRSDSEGRAVNPKLHHWLLVPEGRYWLRHTGSGSFVSLYGLVGQYNAGGVRFPRLLRHRRYEGWGAGAGLAYGYKWRFNRHWGLEASVGAAYAYLRYDKYECGSCGRRLAVRRSKHTAVPRATLSIVYNFSTERRQTLPALVNEADLTDAAAAAVADTSTDIAVVQSEPAPRRVLTDTLRCTVHFRVDRYSTADVADPSELGRLDSLLADVAARPEVRIVSARITGYASPEHTYLHNLALSERRARSLAPFIEGRLGLRPHDIVLTGAGEDWQGLADALADSGLDSAAALIAMIRTVPISDGREEKLRALAGDDYTALANAMFGALRRSVVEIVYTTAN